MTPPKYPVFMFDGLDLIVISCPEDLPVYVERVEYISGDEEVFDSTGRRVILGGRGSRISADADPNESLHIQEFAEKLRAFLRAVNDPIGDDLDCDLDRLMNACRKHV